MVLTLSFYSLAGKKLQLETVDTTGGSRNGKVFKRCRVKQVRRADVKDVFQFLLITI